MGPYSGGANVCNVSTANLDAPTRNLQTVQDKHADQRAIKESAVPRPMRPSFDPVQPPCLDITDFKKCVHSQDVLCSAVESAV